jgi:hypothetical protein
MLIQIGYDIELAVNAPTTLLGALHVHPSRAHDLQGPEQFAVEPALPITTYQDGFDNTITRVDVPLGVASVRFTNHAVVADSGLPDPVVPDARQHPLHELPLEVFRFLLPSRYCEVDSELMQFAWNQFGPRPRAGRACRPFATTCTTTSASTTCRRAPTAPRCRAGKKAWACAATSRTWPSRCAAA